MPSSALLTSFEIFSRIGSLIFSHSYPDREVGRMNLRIHFKLFGLRFEQEGIEAVRVIEHVEEFHILADALE